MKLRWRQNRWKQKKFFFRGHCHRRRQAHAKLMSPRHTAPSWETTITSKDKAQSLIDTSLKTVKNFIHAKHSTMIQAKKIWEKECWNQHLSLVDDTDNALSFSSFAEKSLLVFELNYLFTLWGFLNHCIQSNFFYESQEWLSGKQYLGVLRFSGSLRMYQCGLENTKCS